MIGRWEHRLLTLDGMILMEKNKQHLDYCFSTSFRVLEVRTNYQQMKQIIQVTQAFINASKKKKIIKARELKHEAQVKLEPKFRSSFDKLYLDKFQSVGEEFVKLIESVDNKLLVKWTRACTIEMMTREKVQMAFESKNKKSWLSFISKNAEVPLTEEEIRQIEREIMEFIEQAESSNSVSAGL